MSTVQSQCWCDPSPYDANFGSASPGSTEFQTLLASCAAADRWRDNHVELIRKIGDEHFNKAAECWLRAASRSSVGHLNRKGPLRALLRGLIHATISAPTTGVISALQTFCAWATKNRVTHASDALLTLNLIANEDALAALQSLYTGAVRSSPRQRFARSIAHVQAILGITAEEASERFIQRFDLDINSSRTIEIGGISCLITLKGLTTEITWRDGAAKPCPMPGPGFKKQFSSELKLINETAKAIGESLRTQRDRIDRLSMFGNAEWPWEVFSDRYLKHPIVAQIARNLVWRMSDGRGFIASDGTPRDASGRPLQIASDVRISFWHPAIASVEEVAGWRAGIASLEVAQPFKQAHREVYLITDAERKTRFYSNRFASHILRQHQMANLARARGWDYALQGHWDSGGDGKLTRVLPSENLRAEFWVSVTGEPLPSGISVFVSTDQIRFVALPGNDPVALEQVDPLVFSEILRDVDLFVCVASVGNDPTWQDGGPGGRYQTYWQRYSFGELGETAKTRRAVLETLLPRMTKIKGKWTLADKFLIITGTLRTYKIHLGSGNILMEPNDQYLCIVPGRSDDSMGEKILLPFEGDRTLSIILSKALLLADDAKIKDPTITRQITLH